MIVTTTPGIEGKKIEKYLGVITGEAILGANIFRDMFAAVRDIVGGRSASYERELGKAREIAFEDLEDWADELGANAVVGVNVDYESFGQTNGMMMVSVTGAGGFFFYIFFKKKKKKNIIIIIKYLIFFFFLIKFFFFFMSSTLYL